MSFIYKLVTRCQEWLNCKFILLIWFLIMFICLNHHENFNKLMDYMFFFQYICNFLISNVKIKKQFPINRSAEMVLFQGLNLHISEIEKLCTEFPSTVVLLDHLAFCKPPTWAPPSLDLVIVSLSISSWVKIIKSCSNTCYFAEMMRKIKPSLIS